MSKPRTLTPGAEMRLFAGLAIQPFLAAVVTFVTYPLLFPARVAGAAVGPGRYAIGVALYFGVAALMVTIAFVFPTVVWLVKRRRVSLTEALLFGLAFSNLLVLYTMLGGGGGPRMHALASLIGLMGSAAFWLISIRGRDFSRDPAAAESAAIP